MFLVLEVPDNFDFKRKFSSSQIMGCGDMECGYFTLSLRMLVSHLLYDPRHHGLPRQEDKEETSQAVYINTAR